MNNKCDIHISIARGTAAYNADKTLNLILGWRLTALAKYDLHFLLMKCMHFLHTLHMLLSLQLIQSLMFFGLAVLTTLGCSMSHFHVC